jgi:hypothetical protein
MCRGLDRCSLGGFVYHVGGYIVNADFTFAELLHILPNFEVCLEFYLPKALTLYTL